MGAHSTLMISRDAARLMVAMYLLRPMSDSEMERVLDDALDRSLYNVRICDYMVPRDDKIAMETMTRLCCGE